MDGYPHSTAARAEEPTTALLLSRTAVNELMATETPLAAKILSRTARVISRRMRQATNQVVNAAAQYISGRTRREHDLLGEREVRRNSTTASRRSGRTENFPITGISISPVSRPDYRPGPGQNGRRPGQSGSGASARRNRDAIGEACREIIDGRMHTHFVVDMIQGGAGTSTNMNANEVIANRALEILGRERGDYDACHPNNHVNLSQSTNDVYPTALRLAFIYSSQKLIERPRSSSSRRSGPRGGNSLRSSRWAGPSSRTPYR